MNRYWMVLLGGGIGSLVRYIVGTEIGARFQSRFPLGTITINITGSFLIGLLMVTLINRSQLDSNWRFLLVTGFLGGYTTFSSFEFETYSAVHGGDLWGGLANVVFSVAAGYLAVWLGASFARQ